MLLADLVAASDAAAATTKRTAKVAALADALRACEIPQLPIAIAFLTGEPRQGRIGIGWATVGELRDVPPSSSAALTLVDVDAALAAVEATTGTGSASARLRLLHDVMLRATEPEQSFLRRLLLGELRQGALAGLVTDAIAKAFGVGLASVRRAAMLSGDLGDAAIRAAEGGEPALASVTLAVLRPVQPMLAATAPTTAEAVGLTGEASVEWKLDGARVQVHRDGDEVRVFTRNLNDITERVPGVVRLARSFDIERFVLDGEVIGLADDERPHRFQDTMSTLGTRAIGRRSTDAPVPATTELLRPFFFDVLHVGNETVVDAPLTERISRLDALVGQSAIPRLVTADPDAAERFARTALDAGHEGVVVKALDAPYEAGRRGGAWRKVKPVRTLDLVVLAAEWGSGRRQGWLSNLHLGARDASTGSFVMVGKTFKGLTDELLAWQTRELQERAIGTEGGFVVHVRPELVVEIALDGVQASRRYPGGVALRFARVRRYRPDRLAADADTIEAVQAMLPGRSGQGA